MTITIYEGESKTLAGTIYEADGITAWDGTGYVLSFRAQARYSATAVIGPLASDDVSPQIAWTVAASGTYTVDLTAANTTLAPGHYEAEVRADDGAGGVETVLQFAFVIRDSQYV